MLDVLIPCLILLIVAIVLKKRESANEETGAEKGKKTASKKTNKKLPVRSHRSSNAVPAVTRTTTHDTAVSTATPFDPDFKRTIEQLIKAKSYFSAEAKINQALNQDNSQHGLYLYLFDIHLAQKDEFATKQLINYLRSLGLHELADQAVHKQTSTATAPQQDIDLSSGFNAPVRNLTPSSSSHAAFDALMNQNSAATPTPQAPATFDLNLNDEPAVDPNDYRAFDYVVDEQTPPQKAKTVERDHSTPDMLAFDTLTPVPETSKFVAPSAEVKTEKTVHIAPLEFNFDLMPQAPTPVTDTPAEVLSHPALDFDTQAKNVPQDQPIIESKSEFEFHLETPDTPSNLGFDFKLDPPVATKPADFSYDAHALNLAPQVTADTQANTDPLAQSFPELISHNEIQLNLDLAKKYIQLGTYAAATRLLNEKADQYSSEQRAQSEKLLNQIAS